MIQMLEWCNEKVEVPCSVDELVLVVLNGRYKNKEFVNAIEIASYDGSEGWILEHYPEWENPDVSFWMPMPELPEEVADEST